jgi:hypothetical protein
MRAMLKGNNQNAKGKNKLYLGVLIFGEEVDILVILCGLWVRCGERLRFRGWEK